MGMDHYRIVKQLGGTTATYLAVDKQDEGKKVVIKRLMDGTQGVQELNVSLRVQHPNIIPFLESFVHDRALYVVLAYAEGGDLEAYLEELQREKKPLQQVLLLRWFEQLLRALQCCHGQNIMHRDVKPSNIFLNADATELYLGDFGSAKALLRSASLTSTFVGTPFWISPELLMGTPYSFPSDVWSLGCVFYEMVALRRPFAPTSFASLVQQITSGDIAPLPASTPEDIRAIVVSMLNVNPARRCGLEKALEMTERAIHARTCAVAKSATERVSIERPPPPNIPRRAAGASPNKHQPPQPPRRPSPVEETSPTEIRRGMMDVVVVERKLADWIHARNHDVNIIERYLTKFRQSDEQVLATTTTNSSLVDAQRDRQRDRDRGRCVAVSPPKITTPPRRETQEDDPHSKPGPEREVRAQEATQQPAQSKPAVRSRRRIMSTKINAAKREQNGNHVNRNVSPLAREPSILHSLNGNVSQAFRRLRSAASVARWNSPPAPSPQQEEERQLNREKRERERAKMLEMIRERKAKAIQERKAKGKSEGRDAVAVEIVLPDNVRYVGSPV
ncbi:serine/threonine protein kinase, putative [Trypanosoma cruzi]|nr:serine/threonine protein kinase, putative [Trypanosoma cruzi]KAF8289148.1 putative Serine/threonine-protein kinase NEK14 [Trypanosoma cruzi]